MYGPCVLGVRMGEQAPGKENGNIWRKNSLDIWPPLWSFCLRGMLHWPPNSAKDCERLVLDWFDATHSTHKLHSKILEEKSLGFDRSSHLGEFLLLQALWRNCHKQQVSSKQAASKQQASIMQAAANKHSLKIIQLSDRQSTTFLPQEEVN